MQSLLYSSSLATKTYTKTYGTLAIILGNMHNLIIL